MTIHIGITGTRNGCTERQRIGVQAQLEQHWDGSLGTAFFHHGDCVGVDEESQRWAREFGYVAVGHPPTYSNLRAWTTNEINFPAKPYMVRNQEIVDAVSTLIVVPSGPEAENPRSGTWATYRMAVRAGVETVVIQP